MLQGVSAIPKVDRLDLTRLRVERIEDLSLPSSDMVPAIWKMREAIKNEHFIFIFIFLHFVKFLFLFQISM